MSAAGDTSAGSEEPSRPESGEADSFEADSFEAGDAEADARSDLGAGDPLDGAVDVAIAGLSQAYAHALAIAFEDAVQSQRRRAALADAALARALKGLEGVPPESFRERLAELTAGLDQLSGREPGAMTAYAEMAETYRKALEALAAARPDGRRRR